MAYQARGVERSGQVAGGVRVGVSARVGPQSPTTKRWIWTQGARLGEEQPPTGVAGGLPVPHPRNGGRRSGAPRPAVVDPASRRHRGWVWPRGTFGHSHIGDKVLTTQHACAPLGNVAHPGFKLAASLCSHHSSTARLSQPTRPAEMGTEFGKVPWLIFL